MKIKIRATVEEVGDVDWKDHAPGAVLRIKVHPAHIRELGKLLYREFDAELDFEVAK